MSVYRIFVSSLVLIGGLSCGDDSGPCPATACSATAVLTFDPPISARGDYRFVAEGAACSTTVPGDTPTCDSGIELIPSVDAGVQGLRRFSSDVAAVRLQIEHRGQVAFDETIPLVEQAAAPRCECVSWRGTVHTPVALVSNEGTGGTAGAAAGSGGQISGGGDGGQAGAGGVGGSADAGGAAGETGCTPELLDGSYSIEHTVLSGDCPNLDSGVITFEDGLYSGDERCAQLVQQWDEAACVLTAELADCSDESFQWSWRIVLDEFAADWSRASGTGEFTAADLTGERLCEGEYRLDYRALP